MKREGALIVEVLIAMAVLAIGLLAIASALTFSLGAITRSREAIKTNQALINNVNEYMIERVISHDVSPSGTQVTKISENNTLPISGDKNNSVIFSIYRYKLEGKKASSYYIFQRKD